MVSPVRLEICSTHNARSSATALSESCFRPSCLPPARTLPSNGFCKISASRYEPLNNISINSVSNIYQNRELQIMRIVRHPNIVELKAFYYSNGERVSTRTREAVP